MSNKSSKGVR